MLTSYVDDKYSSIFDDVIRQTVQCMGYEQKKVAFTEPVKDRKREELFPLMLISFLSVMTGMLVFTYSFRYYYTPSITTVYTLFFALFGMIISVLFLQIFVKSRLRERITSTYPRISIKEKKRIEDAIYKKLKSYDYDVSRSYVFRYKDFRAIPDIYAKKKGKEFIFEIRHYDNIIPLASLRALEYIAKKIKGSNKKINLVLITKGKISLSEDIRATLKDWDYIFDLSSIDRLKDL